MATQQASPELDITWNQWLYLTSMITTTKKCQHTQHYPSTYEERMVDHSLPLTSMEKGFSYSPSDYSPPKELEV